MNTIGYGFSTTLEGVDYDRAIERVTGELKKEGFGVLTKIDVRDTFKKKLGVDFRRYAILGACNPNLAHRAIESESNIGLLLPCNVVVQEAPDGGTIVSILDPRAGFALVDNPEVAPVADEVDKRLRRVLDAIATRETAPPSQPEETR